MVRMKGASGPGCSLADSQAGRCGDFSGIVMSGERNVGGAGVDGAGVLSQDSHYRGCISAVWVQRCPMGQRLLDRRVFGHRGQAQCPRGCIQCAQGVLQIQRHGPVLFAELFAVVS